MNSIQNAWIMAAAGILTFACASCTTQPAPMDSAQMEKDWASTKQSGLDAMDNGNFVEAEKQFEKAANDAQVFGAKDPRLAATLNNLASAYEKESKYVQAEETYKKALPLIQQIMGTDSTASAIVMLNLSRVDASEGKLDEADQYCRDAIDIKEKNLGKDNPEVSDAVNELATLYEKQGKYSMALPLYKRAIVTRVHTLGKNDPAVLESLDGYARSLRKTDHNTEAAQIEKIAGNLRSKNAGKTAAPTHKTPG